VAQVGAGLAKFWRTIGFTKVTPPTVAVKVPLLVSVKEKVAVPTAVVVMGAEVNAALNAGPLVR
jgi:hypothetical protein